MSHATFTHRFEVWTQAEEAGTWSLYASNLPGSLMELSPEGSRRESRGAGVNEPDVTHVIRMGSEANVEADDQKPLVTGGRRLRDMADGEEYFVKGTRWRGEVPPGVLVVSAAGHLGKATQ